MISFTFRLLFPQGIEIWYMLTRRLVGDLGLGLHVLEKPVGLPGVEPRIAQPVDCHYTH